MAMKPPPMMSLMSVPNPTKAKALMPKIKKPKKIAVKDPMANLTRLMGKTGLITK